MYIVTWMNEMSKRCPETGRGWGKTKGAKEWGAYGILLPLTQQKKRMVVIEKEKKIIGKRFCQV